DPRSTQPHRRLGAPDRSRGRRRHQPRDGRRRGRGRRRRAGRRNGELRRRPRRLRGQHATAPGAEGMSAAALFFASPLYRWTLAGGAPAALARRLPVRGPGDVENGRAILGGELHLAGRTIRDPAPLWAPAGASEEFLVELHGFAWLGDLIAAGGAAAARAFVRRWIEENGQWDEL